MPTVPADLPEVTHFVSILCVACDPSMRQDSHTDALIDAPVMQWLGVKSSTVPAGERYSLNNNQLE